MTPMSVRNLAVLLPFLWAGAATGQVRLTERPCLSCELRVTPVMSLEGPDVLGEPLAAVLMESGDVFVVFFQAGDEVWAFSPDGAGRLVTRSGEGPGEVRSVATLARLPGDTLVAADAGNRRLSFYTGDGSFVRSGRLEAYIRDRLLPLGGDRFVLAGMGSTEASFQHPLHLLEDGSVVRSFDSLSGDFDPGIPYQQMRNGVVIGERRFATAPKTAYQIRVWNDEGAPIGTFVRDVAWFEPYRERTPIGPGNELDPWFAGLGHLGEGLLLTAVNVPARDWRDHMGEPQERSGGGVWYPDTRLDEMYETRLEVIDLEAGAVIASRTIEGNVGGFAAPDVVVVYREDEVGLPSVELLRVTMTR